MDVVRWSDYVITFDLEGQLVTLQDHVTRPDRARYYRVYVDGKPSKLLVGLNRGSTLWVAVHTDEDQWHRFEAQDPVAAVILWYVKKAEDEENESAT